MPSRDEYSPLFPGIGVNIVFFLPKNLTELNNSVRIISEYFEAVSESCNKY